MYASKILIAAVAMSAMAVMSPASAATVTGVAVSGNGSNTVVGTYTPAGGGPAGDTNALGATAIQYFVPLGNASGTYGVGGFGQSADTGNGGGTLSMYLKFSPVSGSSVLNVKFQDLDLNGVNDPANFLESLQVFTGAGVALTGLITNIGGIVTGDTNSQTLTLALGVVNDPLYLLLNFKASTPTNGTNTPEYLIATVSNVPLPGALMLFGSGLAGLAMLGRRRKRPQATAA